ncbi:hypothetical protein SNE40_014111 [Patella caerulea]|uniref:UBX domain-containing protein 7 n=2 Tax=Patella caerulea TaxID=87958 RepID=A0AAN8JJJ8_PATCE
MATVCGVNESLLEQFCAVTGANKDVGQRLLEACNYNLEMAIGMHMDGGEAQGDGPSQVASSSCPLNDDVDDLQSSIRAPIPQKREVLVEDSPVSAYRGRKLPAASVFDGFRDFQAETRQQEEKLLGGSASTSSSTTNPSKQRTLEDLFRPPIDLTFKGTFQKAREAGTNKKKWLLVNIQNVQEFQCQVLNRDVWSHSAVRGIVTQHFIFWQVYHDSEEGKKYIQFYEIQEWPYIAIIDPVTGEKMISWHKMDPLTFCDCVTEFLALHSTDSGSDNSPPCKRHKKSTIVDATEDAQLEAAIKASMAESKKTQIYTADSDFDSDVETFSDSDDESERNQSSKTLSQDNSQKVNLDCVNKNGQSTTESSTCKHKIDNSCGRQLNDKQQHVDNEHQWQAHLGKKNDPIANLLIRFPDGNREQLSIPCSSTLMVLVKFAASKGFSPECYELVTNFPRRQISHMDMCDTIEKAGLHPQETVFVQSRS